MISEYGTAIFSCVKSKFERFGRLAQVARDVGRCSLMKNRGHSGGYIYIYIYFELGRKGRYMFGDPVSKITVILKFVGSQ